MNGLEEIEKEAFRLLKYGNKINMFPSADSKEWDQAYGSGMRSCAESIIRLINQAKIQEEITNEAR